jgi:membrane protease YdiL (CAAX protease family)
MTIISILLGRKYGLAGQLVGPVDVVATWPYFAVLGALFALSTILSETLPAFKELKNLYQQALIPQLKNVGVPGLVVLAVGAGIGEEAAFRGLLQTWLTQQAAAMPAATPASSIAAGLISTSVIFGAAHAVTPAYAIFATVAGVIFGVEYINLGLSAAAFTHAVYDFVALITILEIWKVAEDDTKS